MEKDAIIFFFKYPERGKVKTRLAHRLGDDVVFELYKNFIKDILRTCSGLGSDVILAISYDNGDIKDTEFFGEYKCIKQRGEDLGERMYNALAEARDLDYSNLVLIGSDIPDLPKELLEDAFSKLKSCDAVLGPSKDGGYYLIGLKNSAIDRSRSIFEGVDWSTGGVLSATTAKLKARGLAYDFLIPWLDIDDFNDLTNFYKRNEKAGINSGTMRFVSQNIF